MSQEIELKLAFPPQARDKLIACLQMRGERLKPTKTLINTYFDTPERVLGKARVALRTRKIGDEWLQTVKCAAASVGGLSSRPEWEQAYSGVFDFSAVSEAPRQLLERHRDEIVPLFCTNFSRDTFLLRASAGSRVQAMVDVGVIEAGGLSEEICELELELESGSVEDLWSIAIALARELPLVPYDPSKAARGYRLFDGRAEAPFRVQALVLEADRQPAEAFTVLAHRLLEAWQANLWGVLTEAEPEFLHQLRLSLRRMRSLLLFFADELPGDFVHVWSEKLAGISGLTSVGRDLNVMRAHVIEPLVEEVRDLDLKGLKARCEEETARSLGLMRRALWGASCGEALLSFTRALHALPEDCVRAKLPELAHEALGKRRDKARAALAHALTEPSPEALHRLRIRLRRLRHGLEFFAPFLAEEKSASVYLQALGALQEDLGRLNDLSLAQEIARAWAQEDSSLREASAYLRGWSASCLKQRRAALLGECERFLDETPPWARLLKKAAEHAGRKTVG